MVKINRLKAQLDMTFDMKDIGETKQILGIVIHKDKKNGKLWLSQQKCVEKILMRFNMNNVKPIKIPLDSHFNISSSLFPNNDKENDYLSGIPYFNAL